MKINRRDRDIILYAFPNWPQEQRNAWLLGEGSCIIKLSAEMLDKQEIENGKQCDRIRVLTAALRGLLNAEFAYGRITCDCPQCEALSQAKDAANDLLAKGEVGLDRPIIVCLCGSTRFYDEFQQANYDETMNGKIVLSVGFYPHAKAQHGHGEGVGHDSFEKIALDELHLRKIDLSDEILILNVGGYIGQSTARELAYARAHGKVIRFLEDENYPVRLEGEKPV